MIVYPTWETTPSPQVKVEVPVKKKKKKKAKIISGQQKGEQLPLFIDDYEMNTSNIGKVLGQKIDKVIGNILKSDIEKAVDQLKNHKLQPNITYVPTGPIPFPKYPVDFPKYPVDLDDHVAKFKVVEVFDNSIYLKAYNAADNIFNPSGTAKVSIEVTKDQLPPALLQLPSAISLSNKEVAEMFGVPAKTLLAVTVQSTSDGFDPFSDIEPIYTVTFERTVTKEDDLF